MSILIFVIIIAAAIIGLWASATYLGKTPTIQKVFSVLLLVIIIVALLVFMGAIHLPINLN